MGIMCDHCDNAPANVTFQDARMSVCNKCAIIWLNPAPSETDREWRKEIAREAGMMGGCEAYNDAMGWTVETYEDDHDPWGSDGRRR